MPPCHVYAYNRANIRTSVLKSLTFPHEFDHILHAQIRAKVKKMHFWRILGRAKYGQVGCPCKMLFRRVGLRSIGPSS